MDVNEILKTLGPVEERILGKGPLMPMARPWTTPVEPLTASVTEVFFSFFFFEMCHYSVDSMCILIPIMLYREYHSLRMTKILELSALDGVDLYGL